jgi:Z1 domain
VRKFDLSVFRQTGPDLNQYERQLRRLIDQGKSVDSIEQAVRDALRNLAAPGRKSFVIYGEPQSGKTEMMICLTAKLLDDGRPFVLHLLNDSVDLLDQNLGRFRASGLAPSAQNYTDVLDPSIQIGAARHVIFCKKNGKDLQKLLNKIGQVHNITVIDDEADFASPNAKVNQGERTKINDLIAQLLGSTGDYIGVTATPARLDLNNTFDNDSLQWVHFPPHNRYTGQDVFFPLEEPAARRNAPSYQLTLLPQRGDEPKFPRQALFSFLVNVAHMNTYVNSAETNYSILVHTSGKKADHKTDWAVMRDALAALVDHASSKFAQYTENIWNLARHRYPDADPNTLTEYIIKNISRNSIIILNSDRDLQKNGDAATHPSSLFTIVIGGNIVSRGVTFDNLLSMFFTRDVQHKIQQDTYIQRARMFGSRGDYLSHFELTIPTQLYGDWQRCFVFHKLSLEAIVEGSGSPVWLSDARISAVANSSIDRSTVDLNRGEMSFPLFEFNPELDEIANSSLSNVEKIEQLSQAIGGRGFPAYLKRFILRTAPNLNKDLGIHSSSTISNYKEDKDTNKDRIERKKGFFGRSQRMAHPNASHHLKIFRNDARKARLFYKYEGSVQFIKNVK